MKQAFHEDSFLREGHISLRDIIEFLPDPLLISRFSRNTQCPFYLNEKFREIIGYSLEEIPTIETWFEVAYPDAAYRVSVMAEWEHARQHALDNSQSFLFVKARIRCKDGNSKWFNVKASLWKKDIEIILFSNINSLEDKNQELGKLNSLKDKLFTVISHDIRSPLATLKALLNLLMKDHVSPSEIRALIPSINQHVNNVSHLMETLMHWAKSQLNSIRPAATGFDIRESVASSLSLLRPEIRRKSIKIERVNFTTDGMTVFADPEMTGVVVRNLIANAIKFTATSGVIRIGLLRRGDFAEVSVTDNGRGMTGEQIEMILRRESFSRPGTEHEKGTGLGLLFCQEFIEMNGGRLSIVSEVDKGSEFRFTVPLAHS